MNESATKHRAAITKKTLQNPKQRSQTPKKTFHHHHPNPIPPKLHHPDTSPAKTKPAKTQTLHQEPPLPNRRSSPAPPRTTSPESTGTTKRRKPQLLAAAPRRRHRGPKNAPKNGRKTSGQSSFKSGALRGGEGEWGWTWREGGRRRKG